MASRKAEPSWLTRVVVDSIHTDVIREHGGLLGLRDEGGLESALSRARHRWLYDRQRDLAALAAAYAFGLARNHPYNDGNKRIALLAMLTFLAINGQDVDGDDHDVLTIMLGLAAGRVDEAALAAWLRVRMVAIRADNS
jgi:death on curing protein